MSKIFIKPEALLRIMTEEKSKGLKVIYVGMGQSSLETFYVKSIPTANYIDLNEVTETDPVK